MGRETTQRRLGGGRDKKRRKWEIAERCQSHGMDAIVTVSLGIIQFLPCPGKEGII